MGFHKNQIYLMNTFEKLYAIPVHDKVEKKGNLDYLSWANAWAMLKKIHPEAYRTVYEDPSTGFNYFTDGRTAWVKVGVSITMGEGSVPFTQEQIDYLPIMDNRNNSIPVDKISSRDVNDSIQRSTAKAIAMHGLGLVLWTREPQAAPKEIPMEKISLVVDSDNWDRVMKYVVANKDSLSLKEIGENLAYKYKMAAPVKKKIKEAYEG